MSLEIEIQGGQEGALSVTSDNATVVIGTLSVTSRRDTLSYIKKGHSRLHQEGALSVTSRRDTLGYIKKGHSRLHQEGAL